MFDLVVVSHFHTNYPVLVTSNNRNRKWKVETTYLQNLPTEHGAHEVELWRDEKKPESSRQKITQHM